MYVFCPCLAHIFNYVVAKTRFLALSRFFSGSPKNLTPFPLSLHTHEANLFHSMTNAC